MTNSPANTNLRHDIAMSWSAVVANRLLNLVVLIRSSTERDECQP
ncbi:MAG TPA: hypothetical protein VN581_02365 [Patescibacteria group bacterium]|nr:hypothetical protein [Patescibacteria group bacterium]